MNSPARGGSEHALLIRKLQAVADLTQDDIRAIEGLPLRLKDLPAGADLVSQGDRPTECCVVLEGWVARYKLLHRGQRQIFSFHVPGDMPDLQSLHIRTMDHGVCAVTPVRLGIIPHAAMDAAMQRRPGLLIAFWRDTLIDAAIFREWMAGIGRRSAYQRIAHLFCELYLKLLSVGLTGHGGFQMPLTQAEVADALGLTSVHVNRVLKELRGRGLIATSSHRHVSILDWQGLQTAGDFDPTYLHLRTSAANESPS